MNGGFSEELIERIRGGGVIAVLTLDRSGDAVPLARALLAGGVNAMELTLRTPAAVEGLATIKAAVPEMLAGAGTILTPEQVRQVVEAGAAFGVAPGTNPKVVAEAQAAGLPFAPGVATASEVERAVDLGCRVLKFFPAEAMGGLKYLKSLATPYAHLGLRYMPLGGLNAANMADYLASPFVLALGGSWLARREVIQNRDWQTITANAAEAADIVRRVRQANSS